MKRVTLFTLAGAGVLAVAAFAHVPIVRALGAADGCPMGGGKAPSAEALEKARVASVANLRTTNRSTSRKALGFELGVSTRADVAAFAKTHALVCHDELGGAASRCVGEGDIRDLFVRFEKSAGDGARIVAIDAAHAPYDAERAASVAKRIAGDVEQTVGAAPKTRGEASAVHLGSGRYSQYAAEFRFQDFAADVVATNLGDVVVREQYRLLLPL